MELVGPATVVIADGVSGLTDSLRAALLVAESASKLSTETEIRSRVNSIHRRLKSNRESEMGSTVAGVIVRGDGTLILFHVGDSRIYHNEVTSFPHSEDDVSLLPMSNRVALSQWLGMSDADAVNVHTMVLEPARWRRLLLCSDGLVARLGDQKIESLVLQTTDRRGTVRNLTAVMPDLVSPVDAPMDDDETAVLIDVFVEASSQAEVSRQSSVPHPPVETVQPQLEATAKKGWHPFRRK